MDRKTLNLEICAGALYAKPQLHSQSITITGLHWHLDICKNERLSSIVSIKSSTSWHWRYALGLGDHLLVALFVVDAGFALLHLDCLLDVLGPGLRIHDTEDDINFLECQLLGLWHEDPDEDRHGQTEDGEHQERLPSNAVDGGRCNLGDDEVEEPLGCSYENN